MLRNGNLIECIQNVFTNVVILKKNGQKQLTNKCLLTELN